jgi:O-antigen ligase
MPAYFLLAVSVFFISAWVLQRNFQVDSVSRKMQVIPAYLDNKELFQRNNPANNNSVFERLLLWRNTVKMIEENPVTGAGIGNWKILLYKYGIYRHRFYQFGPGLHYEHPHNDYLLMMAECGLVGILLFILFLVFQFREWAGNNPEAARCLE